MDEFYDSDFDPDCQCESEEDKTQRIIEAMISESESIIKDKLETIEYLKKKLEELK